MVPHMRLIHKLKAYGLRENLVRWFKSFLSDRRQRVALGDAVSEWSEVTSGVRQGSVLGSILFILYINDLPDRINNESNLYADDSKIISILRNNTSRTTLHKDLDAVTEWTQNWLMKLNPSKCKVIHFGYPKYPNRI